MLKNRAGEDVPIPFRNERYFCANGVWFFEIRGGKQMGPFVSKKDMEGELLLFIRDQVMLNQTLAQIDQ